MICRCLDGEGRLVARLIPQSIRLSRDEQAPADGLEMTFPLAGLPAVARVELSDENGVIFAGIVDEQNETYTVEDRQTELVCRSFEAILLDNPAYAGTIRNPSRTVLEYGQLRPLGLVCIRRTGKRIPRQLYGFEPGERVHGAGRFFKALRNRCCLDAGCRYSFA